MRALLGIFLLLAGCIPDRETRPSLVDDVAVLAVRGEPAEAEPEDEVAFALLVASPEGTVPDPDARWSFCTAPRAPGESGPVSSACVAEAGDGIGSGATAAAPLPEDACAVHGPDTPPGDFRPRDPDATGGYHQPVRIDLDGAIAFGAERIACQLTNAPVDLIRQFLDDYRPNQNPALSPLALPAAVTAGEEIELAADWDDADAERYLYFDPMRDDLVTRRESMSVSWFATAGSFESDRTGRGEEEDTSSTANRWTAPDQPGTVHLWVVLRDSRGGAAWAEGTIDVE
jgi:hypothetical protein